ncbi:MAG: hypothetical protein U5L00_02455 [Desulfovermiculus sp.]|nr:hypothetical protein [Desulfovermiculus sp.]
MKALNSRYWEKSGCTGNSGPFRLRRLIPLVAAILTCLCFSSSAYADPQSVNPQNAMTAFVVGDALGEAYITAQYEGGISATLKMGVLKDRLRNSAPNCLDSLIGEIDRVIQDLRTALTNQQAMNIVSDFRHAVSNRVWDYCGCEICKPCPEAEENKMWYNVWTPPYGPQALCLTSEEAAARKASGENVVPHGNSCK